MGSYIEKVVFAVFDFVRRVTRPIFIMCKNKKKSSKLAKYQQCFSPAVLAHPVDGLAPYPPKDFLSQEGVFAYSMFFLAEVRFQSSIAHLVDTIFPTVKEEEENVKWAFGFSGEAILLQTYPLFSGIKYHIITNSKNFLKKLDALEVSPPAPWITWPDVEPFSVRPTQGEPEGWWYLYWKPFWTALSHEKQQVYLDANRAHSDWVEYLEWFGGSHFPSSGEDCLKKSDAGR